jgi:hypothetical protein
MKLKDLLEEIVDLLLDVRPATLNARGLGIVTATAN